MSHTQDQPQATGRARSTARGELTRPTTACLIEAMEPRLLFAAQRFVPIPERRVEGRAPDAVVRSLQAEKRRAHRRVLRQQRTLHSLRTLTSVQTLAASTASSSEFAIGTLPSSLPAGAPVSMRVVPPGGVNGPVSVRLTSRGYSQPQLTTDGNGVQTYSHTLAVLGSTLSFTFDPATGDFSYTPDADDRFDFSVEFSVPGQDGQGLPIAQVVNIAPKLVAHEYDLVSSTTSNLPSTESLNYLTANETKGTTKRFNGRDNITTRHAEIAGHTIVFGPGQANGLYERYVHTGGETNLNLDSLAIYAERLVVRGNLRFPATDVTIHARELVFDDGAGTAKIDTTALADTTRAASSTSRGDPGGNGRVGEDGGNVTLRVASVVRPQGSTATRFVLGGAAGEANNLPSWSGGTPRPAYHYLFYYDSAYGSQKLNRAWYSRTSSNAAAWTAPSGSSGASGSVQGITDTSGNIWLHPSVVRPMVSYIKDAYLAGNIEYTRLATAELLATLDGDSDTVGDPDFEHLRAELTTMKNRAEAGLDYFGNPPGWTPMLSLVANLAAYQAEIDPDVERAGG